MLKNFLLTAWRIMVRQKAYTAINILGLSLGIAASMLIIIYVADEQVLVAEFCLPGGY